MTEAEWLTTTNPSALTHHKSGRNERKRRLLSCASVRRVLHLITDDRYLEAVQAAEGYADGAVAEAEMRVIRRLINRLWKNRRFLEAGNHAATAVVAALAKEAIAAIGGLEAAVTARAAEARPNWGAGRDQELQFQCALARDIFGNPFRTVTFDPEWRTGTALALAQQMYESRDFGAMPILADALQDAGCDSADILDHCRSESQHVRGCWVVDLVLGKE